jgi:hypothetical protein
MMLQSPRHHRVGAGWVVFDAAHSLPTHSLNPFGNDVVKDKDAAGPPK